MTAHADIPVFSAREEEAGFNLTPFKKWGSVLERSNEQLPVDDRLCDDLSFHPCSVTSWKHMISRARDTAFMEQLVTINDWGNEHPYIADYLNWGMNDFWTTPYEFMAVNGDCEDYAIAKYYSLRALGIPPDDLRIMIVQDMNLGGIIHAVLAVKQNENMWILDNQSERVTLAKDIYHYKPIYSVNEEKWWRYLPQNP